ncbi:MAG: hypothetical protein GY805_10705 [Chloroflexi bacterium]|nr:hypothetical protein [Chloroflexota bacterium]
MGIHHPILGDLQQFDTTPTRTDGSPAQPEDDFYLYNQFRLRIMSNPHTILPFAEIGVPFSYELSLAVGDADPRVRSTTFLVGGVGLQMVGGFVEGTELVYENGYDPYLDMPPTLSGTATELGRNYIRLSMSDGSVRTFVMDVIVENHLYLPIITR